MLRVTCQHFGPSANACPLPRLPRTGALPRHLSIGACHPVAFLCIHKRCDPLRLSMTYSAGSQIPGRGSRALMSYPVSPWAMPNGLEYSPGALSLPLRVGYQGLDPARRPIPTLTPSPACSESAPPPATQHGGITARLLSSASI